MTYSRSRTLNQRKEKRRSRRRLLLAVNGIMLACIVGIAVLIWRSGDGEEPSLAPPATPSETASSAPTPSEPAPSDSGEPAPSDEAAASPDREDDDTYAEPESGAESVTIALVGDILPAARVLERMMANGFDYPFREARPLLEAADIAAGNLEAPVTERGTPAEDKQYVFRGHSDALQAIKEAGFDFLSLANNHTLDYGWEGLSDTMEALDDIGLKHAGAGIDDKEAFAPAYIESNGLTVAFVSLSRVLPFVSWKADRNHPGLAEAYDPRRAVAAIEAAKENADVVVVMVHWGEERKVEPNKDQKDLAYRFVDAGADLVVGSHPHVLQGFESYKGKWIAYSLGNFVFSTTTRLASETGVLNAECDKEGNCSLMFHPMYAESSQPAPMGEAEGKELLARLSELSFGASVEEDGSIVARN
ncbi:CapA family protein [Paenibacillaceae bacterium WGS1546]|uniref:CapA family protein n=1 Tax=Cohnella sp. WGS1546 TaxID=3366810 RepID=UPI00372D8322